MFERNGCSTQAMKRVRTLMCHSLNQWFKQLTNTISCVGQTTAITAEETHAANVIQNAWRKHRKYVRETANQKLISKAFSSTNPNFVGIKNTKTGDIFYCSKNGKERPFSLPKHDPTLEQQLKGTFKSPYGCNHNAFALLLKSPSNKKTRYDEFLPHIGDLKTIIGNTKINQTLVIAPNAGKALSRLAKEGQSIEIAAFKEAAADLATLHERGYFLLDIKPENLTYHEKQKRVNFIDVDNMVSGVQIGQGNGVRLTVTPGYMTGELFKSIKEDQWNCKLYAKIADERALLIAMIRATSKSDIVSFVKKSYPPELEIDKNLLTAWCSSNIKEELHEGYYHYETVYSILNNPMYVALHKKSRARLVDMIHA